MFTSVTGDWETPQALFDRLDKILGFNFTLDACADKSNTKCKRYFSKKQDGLKQNWDDERVWVNPPYGREIGKWVKKASEGRGGVIVMLLPSRTDTKWFHNYIYNKAEVIFLRGRLKFGDSKNSAPFPSMIVIFREYQ